MGSWYGLERGSRFFTEGGILDGPPHPDFHCCDVSVEASWEVQEGLNSEGVMRNPGVCRARPRREHVLVYRLASGAWDVYPAPELVPRNCIVPSAFLATRSAVLLRPCIYREEC